MEKPPKLEVPESKESAERGRNINIEIDFIRHGEKESFYGNLTDRGKQDAENYGKGKNAKAYHSPVTRAEETGKNIAKSSSYTPRKRKMLANEISEEYMQSYADTTAKHNTDESQALQMYLDTDDKKPDEETLSSREVSARLSKELLRFVRMSERLKNGSEVNIVLVSHSGTIEHLLVDILKEERKDFVKKIGGALEFLEGAKFIINRDEQGQVHLTMELRGGKEEFDVGLLQEIAGS
jgi:broad specificity phosphatase PhoE